MKKKGKRGQFYLIATILIITIVASLLIASNYSKKRSDIKFNHFGEELKIESGYVIDYGIKNSQDLNVLLDNFTRTYINYSSADNLYFIYGNTSEITVSGYKKLSSGSIFINAGLGNKELNLSKGKYNSKKFMNPVKNIEIIVNKIPYNFTLEPGENFYFIISREINGEEYIITK